jgi:broad specificity phosphatase PhoE
MRRTSSRAVEAETPTTSHDPATTLLLIRHAEVEERYHKVFGGTIDMELSKAGLRQAALLEKGLRRFRLDAVYASPMRRVRQTVQSLAAHGFPKPMYREALREVDFGAWTGHAWHEIPERFNARAYDWLEQLERAAIPEAECAQTLMNRIGPCLAEIIKAHAGQTVAVFCHGGVIRVILASLLDMPLSRTAAFEIDYASITHVEIQGNRVQIHLLNFTPWRDLAR